MAVPDSLWHCHRTVVAFLFQGITDRRCLACCSYRQAQRRHHHLPRLPHPERARQPKSVHRRYTHNRRLPPDIMEITAANPCSILFLPSLPTPSPFPSFPFPFLFLLSSLSSPFFPTPFFHLFSFPIRWLLFAAALTNSPTEARKNIKQPQFPPFYFVILYFLYIFVCSYCRLSEGARLLYGKEILSTALAVIRLIEKPENFQ